MTEPEKDITGDLVEGGARNVEEKIRDFGELLDQIESLTDKKKELWRQIYEQAISDRQNAYVMFVSLVKIVQNKSTEHAVHGKTIATYIERMSRATDQLIKLAELIAKADRTNDSIDPEEMFDKINKQR